MSNREEQRRNVKILLVPKFGKEEATGNYTSEAEPFVRQYGEKAEKLTLNNGSEVLYNREQQILLGITGIGKASAASFYTAVLSDPRFDFSTAVILSVGCGGSSTGNSIMGDVILESAVVDYDLVYEEARANPQGEVEYDCYTDAMLDAVNHVFFSQDFIEDAYALIKDLPLKTTDQTKSYIKKHYPGFNRPEPDPRVLKGTAVTSDTYWKGKHGHDRAHALTKLHKCPDPYMICEMEDTASATAARNFRMEKRMLVLRVSVNMDDFAGQTTAEDLWGGDGDYEERVSSDNGETVDLFPTAMENLFVTGRTLIEAVLEGRLSP